MEKENGNFKSQIKVIELSDGTEVGVTLNFKKMLDVRMARKDVYKRFNEIMMDGLKDIFDYLDVLYMGYLCAADNIEDAMSKDEFYELMPTNMAEMVSTTIDLISPKKQTDSEMHLEEKPENVQDV